MQRKYIFLKEEVEVARVKDKSRSRRTAHGYAVESKYGEALEKLLRYLDEKGVYEIKEIRGEPYAVYDDRILQDSNFRKLQSRIRFDFRQYKSSNWNGWVTAEEFALLRKKLGIGLPRGIYGIYCDDKLIYVGKTYFSFVERFKEHTRQIMDTSEARQKKGVHAFLRQQQREGKKIEFKVIVDVSVFDEDRDILEHDIDMMELAILTQYHPKYARQGVVKNYSLSDFRKGLYQSNDWVD